MTKQFIYSSAVVALLAGSFASCSSDDTLDGNVAENELAPISLTVTSDEETSHSTIARTGIIFTGGTELSGTQNVWEKGDVVWVYSTANNYFNKLESVSNSSDAYHEKELNFTSGSNKVSYEPGERVILFNTGVNDGTTNVTTEGSTANITLTRAEDDNLMVCVYGDGETVPTYSDEGNAFSLRRVSAVLKEDGMFYKTTSATKASTASLQNTYTKVYFTMPALNAEDAAKLAKLTYKIVVNVVDEDENEGYPSTISYKFDNTLSTKGSDNEKAFDTKNSPVYGNWGNKLQVKFTADGKDARHKSSSLWNTTAGADDENLGMVFFLLPPDVYTKISVKVRVEAPEGETLDDDIKALCKTYSYTFAPDEDGYYDNSDVNAKSANGFMTEKLGAIWDRTTSAAKPAGFLAKSGASTGWVVTEND